MSSRRSAVSKQIEKQVQLKKPIVANVEKMEISVESIPKRPWEKVDADGNVVKRKKTPEAKHIRIRKHVKPRNAVNCLHELIPGAVYTVENQGGIGQQSSVYVIVEGEKYSGVGPTVKIAKQNAAEAALVSFVKPPVLKTEPGEKNETEDKTPWATLAAFAMYKLFNDWNNGRVGTGDGPLPQPPPHPLMGLSPEIQNYMKQMAAMHLNAGSNAIGQYLDNTTSPTKSPENAKNINAQSNLTKPAKQVPDNAASMHPVMVLHQMRPNVQYNTNKTTGDNNMAYFYVSADIDGNQFTGEGSNLKKAKFHLARDAIYALFGVESCFALPE